MTVLEKLLYGGQVMLIGLAIVFAVLLLLIVVISALSAVVRKADGAAAQKTEKKTVTEAPKAAPAAAPVANVVPQEGPVVMQVSENSELFVVIAAALAAFDSTGKLVVRSVRRVPGWKNAKNAEQIYRF